MGTRTNDWKERLDARMAAYEHAPFDWKNNNCTTFATDWVREVTGKVLQVPITLDARAALRTVVGLGGLLTDARRQLGEPLLGTFAQSGDMVLLKLPRSRGRGIHAFGICIGSVCAAPGTHGLMMVPITEAEAAWHV